VRERGEVVGGVGRKVLVKRRTGRRMRQARGVKDDRQRTKRSKKKGKGPKAGF
jgi:hypothetical protein